MTQDSDTRDTRDSRDTRDTRPDLAKTAKPAVDLSLRGLRTSPTLWLILLNIGVYLFLGSQGINLLSPDPDDLIAWGGNLGPYTLGGEWWRLLSSMFMHGSPMHLLLNMALLLQIGLLSEIVWGKARFLVTYVVAGLFGSLASAWWHTLSVAGSGTVSVGASGALLGIAAALLMQAWYGDDEQTIDLNGIFLLVVLNIGLGFFLPSVDNAAHVGGALAGFVVNGVLMKLNAHAGIAKHAQSAMVFGAGLLALTGLTAQLSTTKIHALAENIRAEQAANVPSQPQDVMEMPGVREKLAAQAAAEEALEARRIAREEAVKREQAEMPAPVSLEEAEGKELRSIEGGFFGQPFHPDPQWWYATNPRKNSFTRLHLANMEFDFEWGTPGPRPKDDGPGCPGNYCDGLRPARVAGGRDGTWVLVGTRARHAVSRIELSEGKTQWSVKVGHRSHDIFLSENEKYAFAVHASEQRLSVIDIENKKLLSTILIGEPESTGTPGFPIEAVKGPGVLYLADKIGNAVYAIDTEAPAELKKVLATGDLTPYHLDLSADGNKLFISGEGGIQMADTRTFKDVEKFFTCSGSEVPEIAVSPDGSRFAVASRRHERVSIVSTRSQKVVRVLPARGSNTMRFSADGKTLYMLSAFDLPEPSTSFRRLDLDKTLDVPAAVDQMGEYLCSDPQEDTRLQNVDTYLLYRSMMNGR